MDVLIHITNNGNFHYSIFRKPTSNNSYIHYFSGHNDSIKRSVFTSMFLRALRIVSPPYFDAEIQYIYEIGHNLKYPNYFIKDCFERSRKTFYRTNDPPPVNISNLLVLPFNNNFFEIRNLLKLLNINVVFSFENNLKSILIRNNHNSINCGIYKIPCNECNQYYIGQTGKSLDVRIKQHQGSVRYGQESNAIFCHVRDNDHRINWSDSRILIKSSNFQERNIIESIIIKNSFNDNSNLS